MELKSGQDTQIFVQYLTHSLYNHVVAIAWLLIYELLSKRTVQFFHLIKSKANYIKLLCFVKCCLAGKA